VSEDDWRPTYIDAQALPELIQRHLPFKRGLVAVYARERESMFNPKASRGVRCKTTLVNLDTGESETHVGSWGGSNPFNQRNAVDQDTTERPLPPHGAVIHSAEGHKPSANLTVHPSRLQKLLPPASETPLSADAALMLSVYRTYNTRGRRDWLASDRRVPQDLDAVQAELVKRGYIKRNRAGAVTVTAEGRNVTISKENRARTYGYG
jgi:hypothetical protein